MQNPTRRLTTLALLALIAGCASTPPPPAPRAPIKLTILHTNDHHGRFWPNAQGEYGMAARKTLVDRVRAEVAAEGGYLLFLDGGDVNTGVPESNLQDAEPDFLGMNRLGVDAMAVGNHEFDKPLEVLARQRTWISFPMLSANIYRQTPTGVERMFQPYTFFERGGYKIAVLGLTTDDTAKMVLPSNVRGIEFRKPIAEAAALLPTLRAQADMVIAVTHMGHYPNGNRGVNAPGDVEMARQTKGLDLIVGGHSQNPVCMLAENQRNEAYVPGTPCAPDRQNGTWIVQAHEWGKYVGRADFEVSAGKIELLRYQLLPVNLLKKGADGKPELATPRIPEDPTMRAFLQRYQELGQAQLMVTVGSADGVLDGDRAHVRRQPTNLGLMLARAMQERTGADLALMNAGGIRDSLPAGTLSYRDLLKVQPFANTISTVRLSGAELLQYLGAAAKMTAGAGGFPHTSGLRWRIAGGVVESAEVGGKPIDPARSYLLAINNFTAIGGDGYPVLEKHPGHVNTGLIDVEVLREFIAAKSPLKIADYEPGDATQRR
jgi:5'-nucleotidase/UDP-sugar diphosphatase